ncbi:helicase-associated domain-containing protein [Mycobacterium spongiae]|uniref:DNA-binding protein n=1 Tax=Mycobacterium spongiae TaxID=886343 RepID=A0A975K0M6_9MYCO|nr:helicase-associated domain-containing protein [Mycobacterium spongiae]QUR68868.1 DNA-binding protein [Mycobacterium spongiae]
MTEHTPDIPLGSWLADLPDERLIRLLELRPDLAQPPPGSIAALAARAQARQSVKAATDELDFLRLAILDALLVLQADTAPVPITKVLSLVGDRAAHTDVIDALDDLKQRALAWGDATVRVAADAGTALPWHQGQVTLEESSRTADQINELLAALTQSQRDVLEKLLAGSPIGRTRDAAPGAQPDRPVPQLLSMGLLRRIDAETVILPRHVGQVLRGEQPGPMQLTAPDPVVSATTEADVDAAAAGAAIDLLRELDVLFDTLGTAPVAELRSGGLGVREIKRLAKTTGIDEPRLGLILELAAAAGLIAGGMPDPEPSHGEGPFWAPTVTADRFTAASPAERWHWLASTWLDLPGRPALIGSRGPDAKPYAALSDSLFSTAAPLDRRLLLGILAELPAGSGVDAHRASAALIWRRPRWARRLQPRPVADLLAEAHALGLVGRGAISTPGRAFLRETADPAAITAAMTTALPKPIDHFLVQADLTVVVPGPLERDLAEDLATVATVESAGAAMVYRVSEQSIRHGLDVGKTPDWMHTFFTNRSRTAVPQGLTYLIDDVARRHGQLRIGMAASFVRCEDPALLAQAVSAPAAEELQLRTLAPTVAVSPAPIGEVLAVLRSAGLSPAAEDSTGAIVDVRTRGARVPPPQQQRRPYRTTPRPSNETLNAIVAVLRTVTTAPFGNTRVDPTVIMSLLQRAASERATLVVGYLDAAGVATQRVLSPVAVRGGQLAAFDSASGRLRDFAIHRITSVSSFDDQ